MFDIWGRLSGHIWPWADRTVDLGAPNARFRTLYVETLDAETGGGGAAPHAATHQNNGSDEISVAGLSGVLADPQTPAAHSHAQADVTGLVAALDRLPTIVRKASDQSVTSGTVSEDVSGLGFALAANTSYIIRYVMRYNTDTQVGVTWGLQGPASPTALMGGAFLHISTTDLMISRAVGVYSDALFSGSGVPSSSNGFMFLWEINITTGASTGTLIPRFRSSSDGTAVTVFAGSYGMRWKG